MNKILQQFIDAKWYTVPLGGLLVRKTDGSKSVPKFPRNWKSAYAETFNDVAVPLAGALTGALSNIVAIDCDNQATYDIFTALDPTYNFHFKSLGKKSGGGTIIYKYIEDIPTFSVADGNIQLDYFADGGFIYLPTEDNKTKELWEFDKLPAIKELPLPTIALLKSLSNKQSTQVTTKKLGMSSHSHRLAPMVERFLKNDGEYDPTLFKIITPQIFRQSVTYVKQGHLHPKDLENGTASNYLSRVSAVLGADISISKELYVEVIVAVNALMSKPIDKSRVDDTIIKPMIDETAMIDNVPIWHYDANWENMGLLATDMRGDSIEVFFDDYKGMFYLINYTAPYIRPEISKSKEIELYKTLTGIPITKPQFDSSKLLIRTQLLPNLPFGHMQDGKFNLFVRTPELSVLNSPDNYATAYKKPICTLKYFETLIPNEFMRNFLFSFLRTKLTTFKPSPIILYMVGVPGSGKDTFTDILSTIIGGDYTTKPNAKVFLETHNGWIMDKFFVQLDEYGNSLTRYADKQEVLGRLKTYSGSDSLMIRSMGQDGFKHKHLTTFILTANSNPFPLEIDDRRVAYLRTPNNLAEADWVKDHGGIAEVILKIKEKEVIDFCYYLATEVKNLTGDEYNKPPMTEERDEMILDGLYPSEKIAYLIHKKMFVRLKQLAGDYGVAHFTDSWKDGRIRHERLAELYQSLTGGAGDEKANSVVMALKKYGYKREYTTLANVGKISYYAVAQVAEIPDGILEDTNFTTLNDDIPF